MQPTKNFSPNITPRHRPTIFSWQHSDLQGQIFTHHEDIIYLNSVLYTSLCNENVGLISCSFEVFRCIIWNLNFHSIKIFSQYYHVILTLHCRMYSPNVSIWPSSKSNILSMWYVASCCALSHVTVWEFRGLRKSVDELWYAETFYAWIQFVVSEIWFLEVLSSPYP